MRDRHKEYLPPGKQKTLACARSCRGYARARACAAPCMRQGSCRPHAPQWRPSCLGHKCRWLPAEGSPHLPARAQCSKAGTRAGGQRHMGARIKEFERAAQAECRAAACTTAASLMAALVSWPGASCVACHVRRYIYMQVCLAEGWRQPPQRQQCNGFAICCLGGAGGQDQVHACVLLACCLQDKESRIRTTGPVHSALAMLKFEPRSKRAWRGVVCVQDWCSRCSKEGPFYCMHASSDGSKNRLKRVEAGHWHMRRPCPGQG